MQHTGSPREVAYFVPAPRARALTDSERPSSERPKAEAKRIKNYVIVKERCAFPKLGARRRWQRGNLQRAGPAGDRRRISAVVL